MSVKYTRGYYLRGFGSMGLAVGVVILVSSPAMPGELRGLIYFLAFGVSLGILETVAKRRGWPSKIRKGD